MRLIYWYFRIALFLGFKAHVYNLSSRWGSTTNKMPRRYGAAWEVQKDLLKRGFHECPSCHWATRNLHEHYLEADYCFEEALWS